MARIERTLAEASRTLALHSNLQVPGPLDLPWVWPRCARELGETRRLTNLTLVLRVCMMLVRVSGHKCPLAGRQDDGGQGPTAGP